MKSLTKHILVILLVLGHVTSGWAQETSATDKPKSGPRKQLATIVFSGLGGAVLGLSTLSFYGRPQEHLNNIAIGFAVGIIVGTVFVTYSTAKSPTYYEKQAVENPEFSNHAALAQRKSNEFKQSPTYSLFQYQF